jgi:membrane-bound serine protease (ClpP class)
MTSIPLLLAALLFAGPAEAGLSPSGPFQAVAASGAGPAVPVAGDAGADTTASAADGGQAVGAGGVVTLIRVEEAISPTTTNYVRRALAEAVAQGSAALVIELDTPGGLLESTQHIVRELFQAGLPVVVYVSPEGARAASAGTFITMAAHVAAMAPSTTIGAASPVTMAPGAQADTVMQQKMFSATESFIETIAERRGRNVEWAISAVRDGASVTGREALALGVIDLVAVDREELLQAVDGMEVNGYTLRTAGAVVEEMPKNLAERFLGFIIRPELMLILMLVAIYGIMGEVTNPGGIIPGVAGVIALILLLYASAAMPINTAGYVLMALAIALFIAEAFTPTFGLLIAAGAVAFFLGGLMLFQDLPEPMELPWGYLVPATLLTAAFFVWIATYGLKAQLAPARTGLGTLVGQPAQVVDPVGPSGGRVFVAGEYWNAVSAEEIEEGASCRIEGVDGLTLRVRPGQGEPAATARNP